jgi:hypothetical protein
MRIESVYTTSYIIGSGPRGNAEVHKKEVDDQGRVRYTVEEHPFISYSSKGQMEIEKTLGANLDKIT